MFKNYLRIALRNLSRHRAYTAINITGLAVGIAACLLMFTVITYEWSYEKFQPHYKQIYRVVAEDKFAEGYEYTPGIPFPALETFQTNFPGIKTGALFCSYGSQVTVIDKGNTGSKKFIEQSGFFFADPTFFQVFKYEWLEGNPSILKDPNVTVLTQTMANKYFGDWKNAMGQSLLLDNRATVKVAGILKDPPANTDFPIGIISSIETAKANGEFYGYTNDWNNTTSNFQLFMLLPQNINAASINKQLADFSNNQYKEKQRSKRTHVLQPLSETHFDNRYTNFGDHITSKTTLYTLSLIGLFIILMACINFINLSTAQAVGRSKEIGVRKVLGSSRTQLFFQVIAETTFLVFISILLATVISYYCLPYIKHIASIQEQIKLFTQQTYLFLGLLLVTVSVLAGIYPALILSGFNPAMALKNKITSATVGGISLRRALVVLQFAISQVLIIGTVIAVSQMNFIRNADLGFNKEAVYVISANADSIIHSGQEAFKRKLLQIPGVEAVSFSSDIPSSENNWSGNFSYNHQEDAPFNIFRKAGDEDYFKTYGLELVAGRVYGKSDTARELVINETLVKKLGIKNPNEVIGKELRSGRSSWKTIVGVVKDFKTNSLREDVKPTMIFESRNRYGTTGIKFKTNNITRTKTAVDAAWNEFYPAYAFTSAFMDENITNFYRQEEQLSLLYKIFAGIALFISCLGLYGLVSFMAVQRTREIGIRKVLGASVQHIIYLFSKEFTLLIIIGFLIAAPVAWWMMNNWLQNFVFRVDIGVQVFLIAIVASVFIAWVTVGYKSLRAALKNPVISLKSE